MQNREIEGGVGGFTVTQCQELEHQALIYKYLLAGLPVPLDLLSSIQSTLSSSPFIHNNPSFSLGYSYYGRESSLNGYGYGYGYGYGKKVDPEPGRCRRTDGKKWRCSKEAYPDSKYCERHMHRGRSRSRKPVESQPLSSSNTSSSSSSLTYVSRALDQTPSLQLNFSALGSASSADNSDRSEIRLDSIPYAIPTKPYSRHLQGCKPEASEHRSYTQPSDGNRSLLMDSTLDNKWPTMLPSFSPSKTMDSSSSHYDYGHQSYVNCDSGPTQPAKQTGQSLQPFFELWPKSREAWSGLEDDGANQVPFSTSDLSTTPQSP